MCNLFLVAEPLAGWREVMVSARRTRIDWAHSHQGPGRVHYPDAEQIVLVKDDNLNTHTPASLCAAFAPAEAKRLADRLELHYTPKHGSWLQHGRARAGHAGRTMPGPSAGRPADLETGGRSLEGVAQPGRSSGT